MLYLASDHRGYELKEKIKTWLTEWNIPFEDNGPNSLNPEDDYPDYISKTGEAISQGEDGSKGIILGYSGQGEAMVANKYKNVRAVVYYGGNEEIIKLSRQHNNSNVLSLGAGFIDEDITKSIIKLWLDTPFSEEERHKRRIDKIKKIEKEKLK